MLKSEKDAELFYEAQRKFTDRQRMIDKGWGDLVVWRQSYYVYCSLVLIT